MVAKRITIAAFSDLTHDQRLRRISQSLATHGFRVDLWGRIFPGSVDLQTEVFKQKRLTFWFNKGKTGYLEFSIRLFFRLLFHRTDAICSVDLDTLPACWLVAKLKRIKLVHDAHEYMEEVPEVYNRPATKALWNLVARLFLPGTDLCYTVSSSLVEEFMRKYNKEFLLVRNMPFRVESRQYQPVKSYGTGYWVFLGAVNKGRGLEQFLDVLPSTNRKLIILGTGDLMPELKEMIQEKMLDHLVVFTGKLRPEEMAPILQHAWAGINMLTDEGLSYRYSLANKFFDYVHAGLPQICIAFPEYQKLMKQHEVGVLTRLENKYLRAACEIISLPEKQLHFRAECTKAKENWNWQNEEQELIQAYEMLLN